MPVHKSTFLKVIRIRENPEGFKVQEPSIEEFQVFLNHINWVYTEEFKGKKFKKLAVSGLWTVLMNFILRGLSGKHGGTDTLIKD